MRSIRRIYQIRFRGVDSWWRMICSVVSPMDAPWMAKNNSEVANEWIILPNWYNHDWLLCFALLHGWLQDKRLYTDFENINCFLFFLIDVVREGVSIFSITWGRATHLRSLRAIWSLSVCETNAPFLEQTTGVRKKRISNRFQWLF